MNFWRFFMPLRGSLFHLQSARVAIFYPSHLRRIFDFPFWKTPRVHKGWIHGSLFGERRGKVGKWAVGRGKRAHHSPFPHFLTCSLPHLPTFPPSQVRARPGNGASTGDP